MLGDQGGGAWSCLLCGLIRLADRGDLLPCHINLIEFFEIGPTPNDWITLQIGRHRSNLGLWRQVF